VDAQQHPNQPRNTEVKACKRQTALLLGITIATHNLFAAAAWAGPTAGLVFTANEGDNSVSRIDLKAGTVVTETLPLTPHNIDVSQSGGPLLAVGPAASIAHASDNDSANSHGHAEGGLLAVLDPATALVSATIAVGDHPAHVVGLADGSRAFVTNAGEDTVGVVDLAAGQMFNRIPTGRYPHGMRLNPDETLLLVANVESGDVSLIDVVTETELARIPVGKAPVQVAFLADGTKAYVTLRDEDAVAVLDMKTRTITAKIPVGDGPVQLHATPDGRYVFVANQGSEEHPGNTVSALDVAKGTEITKIQTGLQAHGIDVAADGQAVFVTNLGDNSVSVIDAATLQVVSTFSVGKAPNGITFKLP
jgi:YVTN family beta-propeller protein